MPPLAFRASVGFLLLDGGVRHLPGLRGAEAISVARHPNGDSAGLVAPTSLPAGGSLLERRSLSHSHGRSKVPTLREAVPSLLMASLAGLTTVLGALVVFAMPEGPPPWAMALTLSLAAGVMVTVATELIWGKSKGHHLGPWLLFLSGVVSTWILTFLATRLEQMQREPGEDATKPNVRSMWRLAVVLFISLTLHNFPEGMAVAVSALESQKLGLTICIGIACHNIPEGITIAVTTYEATKSRSRALLMTFLSAVAEPLGAVCAVLVFRNFLTEYVVECLVAAVAGVMLYIAVGELLPEALSSKRWLWVSLGFVMGIVVIVITTVVIDNSFG